MADFPRHRLLADRFVLHEVIASGKSATSYRALDRSTDTVFVVKTIQIGAQHPRHHSLERELKHWVEHPSQPYLEFGIDGSILWFMRPYAQGLSLPQYMAHHRLSTLEVLELGINVLGQLAAIHKSGNLHLNIKPSNIIVNELPPIRTVTLVDPLVGSWYGNELVISQALRDDVRYFSPEVSGLIEFPPQTCSDLYSLGTILFECVIGRPLYDAVDINELLRQHANLVPPKLRKLGYPVPRAIDDALHRLLRKNPEERYQTSRGILEDLTLMRERMMDGHSDPRIAIGHQDIRHDLVASVFIGRENEFRQLQQSLYRAERGYAQLVQVCGQAGSGKSALLRELAEFADQRGVLVFRALSEDNTAQKPFGMLEKVAEQVVAYSLQDETYAKALASKLSPFASVLLPALPRLKKVMPQIKEMQPSSEAMAANLTREAIEAFLTRIGSPIHPALLILDDCHWADELSVSLIDQWKGKTQSSKNKTSLMIVTAISTDMPQFSGDIFRNFNHSIQLGPLSRQEVKSLVASMAGPLPIPAISLICELAQGSPFFAESTLKGLVEYGALVPAASGWEINSRELNNFQSTQQAAYVLAKRLEILPEESLRVLRVAAIIGVNFSMATLSAVVELGEEKLYQLISAAKMRQLIWEKLPGQFTFTHSKVRETLSDQLGQEKKARIHWQVAQVMKTREDIYLFEIAHHLAASGHCADAVPIAIKAADQARLRFSLETALRQYEIAYQHLAHAEHWEKREILLGLGEVNLLLGRLDDADRFLKEASHDSWNKSTSAIISFRRAAIAFRRGSIRDTEILLHESLGYLGLRVWKGSLVFALLLGKEFTVQWLRNLIRYRLHAFSEHRNSNEDDAFRIRSLDLLGAISRRTRQYLKSLWCHIRQLNLAESYGEQPELVDAYATHAEFLSGLALHSRAKNYAKRALLLAEKLDDQFRVAKAGKSCAIVCYLSGEFEQALKFTEGAQLAMDQSGDQWEANHLQFLKGLILYRMGELKRAQYVAQELLEYAETSRDRLAAALAMSISARVSPQEIAKETLQLLQSELIADPYMHSILAEVEGIIMMIEGDFRKSRELFTRVLDDKLTGRGLESEFFFGLYIWQMQAIRRSVSQVSPFQTRRHKQLLAMWRRSFRLVAKLSKRFPVFHPQALREQAYYLASKGRARAALKAIEDSIAIARQQGAVYEQVISEWVGGYLGQLLDWEHAERFLASAQAALSPRFINGTLGLLEQVQKDGSTNVTVSLVDRFDQILAAGREIASALSREEVYERILGATLRLLRGEDCAILKRTGRSGAPTRKVLGELLYSQNEDLVALALNQKKTVFLTPNSQRKVDGEILSLGKSKSILCIPLNDNGTYDKCIYTSHSALPNLFGPNEVHLAEFIATLASAALENAAGFAKTKKLSEQLEADIQRRKATESQLQSSLKEKEILLKEVYHRTKNNMQIVSSLLNLQAQSLHDSTLQEILIECQNRIRSMSLAHDKLYRSDSLAQIDLKDYLRTLVESLHRTFRSSVDHIRLEFDLESVPLNVESTIPCGLIVNELVTNSMKYAFPSAGRGLIQVSARIIEDPEFGKDTILVTIKDNGVGIPKTFDLSNLSKSDSLGLSLVYGLTRNQLNGRIDVLSDHGTEFRILFKQLKYEARLKNVG